MLVSMIPTGNTSSTSTVTVPTIENDAMKGTPYAPVTIIGFSEYECSYCKTADATIKQILADYPDKVNYVFRDFPLSDQHPHAEKAAQAAECAGTQGKYWEMHDVLFEHQDALAIADLKNYAAGLGLNATLFNECLDSGAMASEVLTDLSDGEKAGVDAVPTFFINGRKLKGAQPIDAFKAIIDEELAKVR
jgi:protein-disulfide isomerase